MMFEFSVLTTDISDDALCASIKKFGCKGRIRMTLTRPQELLSHKRAERARVVLLCGRDSEGYGDVLDALDAKSEGFKSARCLRHYMGSCPGFKIRTALPAVERGIRILNLHHEVGLYPSFNVLVFCSEVDLDGSAGDDC
jgi:hypothetical protein